MFNFDEALAELLQLYGDIVRNSGEIEHRDVQRWLYHISGIVRDQDVDALQNELEDMREWAKESPFV